MILLLLASSKHWTMFELVWWAKAALWLSRWLTSSHLQPQDLRSGWARAVEEGSLTGLTVPCVHCLELDTVKLQPEIPF